MEEIYKPIKNYEEYYEISNFGNVRSKITNKILVGDKNNIGYRRVILYKPTKKRFFVHRLVAEHFVNGELLDNLVVNHIDGDKTNNHYTNLEIVTRSENDLHAYDLGLRIKNTSKKVAKVDIVTGEIIEIYDSIASAGRMNNMCASVLSNILNGKIKQRNDFYWKCI